MVHYFNNLPVNLFSYLFIFQTRVILVNYADVDVFSHKFWKKINKTI